MIALPTNTRIWIAAGVTDMRRGFTGLSAGVWGALRPIEQLQAIFGYRNACLFPERVFMPAGQSSGLIREIKPAAEVFADLVRETEAAIARTYAVLSRPAGAAHAAALR